MFAKFSNKQLIDNSDAIIFAELIDKKTIRLDCKDIMVGVLQAKKVLKGDKEKKQFFLLLPASTGLHKSDDAFFKIGQKGYWFLRQHKPKSKPVIYIADHPQRFLSAESSDNKIKEIQIIIEAKSL
ncbi:MAG: hypothetical protein ABIJ59_14250 [Pseudomonadota bacterium]